MEDRRWLVPLGWAVSVAMATHPVPATAWVHESMYFGGYNMLSASGQREWMCGCQRSTGRRQWLNVEILCMSSQRELTCPLKASMMKCRAWGWTHSIHFCTTWLPFWSLTHFNTWPSSSRTISLCRREEDRGDDGGEQNKGRDAITRNHILPGSVFQTLLHFSQCLIAQQIILGFKQLPWRKLRRSIKKRWIPFPREHTQPTLSSKTNGFKQNHFLLIVSQIHLNTCSSTFAYKLWYH